MREQLHAQFTFQFLDRIRRWRLHDGAFFGNSQEAAKTSQRIAPNGFGKNAVADIGGLGKSHVVQIIVQSLDLLGERDFIEVDGDLRVFLPAQCH